MIFMSINIDPDLDILVINLTTIDGKFNIDDHSMSRSQSFIIQE